MADVPAQRLRELAEVAAQEANEWCREEETICHRSNQGHDVDDDALCSHPDCVLVRPPEETQEPRASERDVNMICGIVVCSFLDAPEKDRLCDLVRELAALPTQEKPR